MKRFLLICCVALLLIGHALNLKEPDKFIGGEDDLIEIYSEGSVVGI